MNRFKSMNISFDQAILAKLTSRVNAVVSVADQCGFDFGGSTLAGFINLELATAWAKTQSVDDFRVFRVFCLVSHRVAMTFQHGQILEDCVNVELENDKGDEVNDHEVNDVEG